MIYHHNAVIASTGFSSGLAGKSFFDWLASPSAGQALTFLGAAASAVFTFVVAKRQEAVRARTALEDEAARSRLALEQEAARARLALEAEKREQDRFQRFLDALNVAAIGRLTTDPVTVPPDHVESSDDRARRLAVAWPPPDEPRPQ